VDDRFNAISTGHQLRSSIRVHGRQEVTIIPSGKIAQKVLLKFERWTIISDLNFRQRLDYFLKTP
jgi:hypothetical protein